MESLCLGPRGRIQTSWTIGAGLQHVCTRYGGEHALQPQRSNTDVLQLPSETSKIDLLERFTEIGRVENAAVLHAPRCIPSQAPVEFASADQAAAAAAAGRSATAWQDTAFAGSSLFLFEFEQVSTKRGSAAVPGADEDPKCSGQEPREWRDDSPEREKDPWIEKLLKIPMNRFAEMRDLLDQCSHRHLQRDATTLFAKAEHAETWSSCDHAQICVHHAVVLLWLEQSQGSVRRLLSGNRPSAMQFFGEVRERYDEVRSKPETNRVSAGGLGGGDGGRD